MAGDHQAPATGTRSSTLHGEETLGNRPPAMAVLRLVRPHQWVKNVLVLAPLLFAGLFLHPPSIVNALVAAAMFSLTASAGYVYNDIQDIEKDRQHPEKRHRPLPSGDLTPTQAWAVLGGLLVVLAVGATLVPWTVTLALVGYLALTGSYSALAKHIPVIDLFAISLGFVLRVWVGAEAIGVSLSSWMAITTLCLALYLGTIKRLAELTQHGDDARAVLSEYDAKTLEGFALISATCAVVFYALYTFVNYGQLAMTLPFVLFGFFRYWHLVRVEETGSEPIRDALRDRPIVAAVGLWGLLTLYHLWPG